MMRRLLCLVFLALAVAVAPAQELITLATPVTSPNAVTVKFERLVLDLPAQTVSVQWVIVDAVRGQCLLSDAAACRSSVAAERGDALEHVEHREYELDQSDQAGVSASPSRRLYRSRGDQWHAVALSSGA